jgi:hypothetical protein
VTRTFFGLNTLSPQICPTVNKEFAELQSGLKHGINLPESAGKLESAAVSAAGDGQVSACFQRQANA